MLWPKSLRRLVQCVVVVLCLFCVGCCLEDNKGFKQNDRPVIYKKTPVFMVLSKSMFSICFIKVQND